MTATTAPHIDPLEWEAAVWGTARKFVRPGEDLEDLASVGRVGLIEALRSFNLSRGIPLRAYVFSRIRYAIIRHLRNGQSVWSTNESSLGETASIADLATCEPDHEAVASPDGRTEVERLLSQLPDREAEVLKIAFRLRGEPKMTQVEIGERLGISATSVRQLIRVATQRLRGLSSNQPAIQPTEAPDMSITNGYHAPAASRMPPPPDPAPNGACSCGTPYGVRRLCHNALCPKSGEYKRAAARAKQRVEATQPPPPMATPTMPKDGRCPTCKCRYKNPKVAVCYRERCPSFRVGAQRSVKPAAPPPPPRSRPAPDVPPMVQSPAALSSQFSEYELVAAITEGMAKLPADAVGRVAHWVSVHYGR